MSLYEQFIQWISSLNTQQVADWLKQLEWKQEEKAAQKPSPKAQGMPLVDKHTTHRRIRPLSAGIFVNEKPVGTPAEIAWAAQEWELKKMGLDLNAEPPAA